jgi:hypothetical protein
MRLHHWVRSELFGPLRLQSFASLHSSPTVLALSLVLCTHHPFSVVMAFSVKKACILWWKKNSVLQSFCSGSILWSTQATKGAMSIELCWLCFVHTDGLSVLLGGWKPNKIVWDKDYSDVQDFCYWAIFCSRCLTKQIGNVVECAFQNQTLQSNFFEYSWTLQCPLQC